MAVAQVNISRGQMEVPYIFLQKLKAIEFEIFFFHNAGFYYYFIWCKRSNLHHIELNSGPPALI